MASFEQTDVGQAASRTINGITYAAQEMGSDGNSITIALVAGGTAGAEVVTVTGTAISIQIESGVSTRTQVVDAVEADAEASELINLSASSGGTAATLSSALPLQNGDDTDFDASSNCMSLSEVHPGVYAISIPDSYAALLGASIISLQDNYGGALGRTPIILSADVTDAKEIVVAMTEAGVYPSQSMSNGDVIYICLELRNSSNTGLGG